MINVLLIFYLSTERSIYRETTVIVVVVEGRVVEERVIEGRVVEGRVVEGRVCRHLEHWWWKLGVWHILWKYVGLDLITSYLYKTSQRKKCTKNTDKII